MYCTGIGGSSGLVNRRRLFLLLSLQCSPVGTVVLKLPDSGLLYC